MRTESSVPSRSGPRSCPAPPLGDPGDEQLEPGRRVLVVGVGLVPLEHRELGVVLWRDALVAEVLAELVDAIDPADDEPLQVELGRDPQVEVAVEGVVVGGERARQGAAVERLQDRRLDLDEAVVVEPAADLGDRPCAGRGTSRAPPRWRSGRARAGGSGSRRPRGRGTCRAAVAGSSPAGASRRLGARARRARVANAVPSTPTMSPRSSASRAACGSSPSTSSRACSWIWPLPSGRSRKAALPWPRRADEPARDPVARNRSPPPPQPLVRGPHLGDRLPPVELVRERLDPGVAQPLELLPALAEEIGLAAFVCRLALVHLIRRDQPNRSEAEVRRY